MTASCALASSVDAILSRLRLQMALYSYGIVVVRCIGSRALPYDLLACSLTRHEGATWFVLDLECEFRHVVRQDLGVEIVTITPDTDAFERILYKAGTQFRDWLWGLCRADVDFAYVPSGGDSEYLENDVPISNQIIPQLPELLSQGIVRFVHPVMYFGDRVAAKGMYERLQRLSLPVREMRPGKGCLLMLAECSNDRLEILEPGSLYTSLREEFR
jgi:hypothetical protein